MNVEIKKFDMKKCAFIGYFGKSEYIRKLTNNIIGYFNRKNIDVIIASSDYIPSFDGVKNYITLRNVVDKNYITTGLYPMFCIQENKFIKMSAYQNKNVNPYNYFIKLHQILPNYASLLGYDYYYYVDADSVLRESHFDIITSDSWDYTKMHLYTLGNNSVVYMFSLIHGNLTVAKKLFSEENLDYVSEVSKVRTIMVNECALYEIAQKHLDESVIHDKTQAEVFEKFNTCSSRNVASVFFKRDSNEFYFLQYKGDHGDNQFSAKLLDGNGNILVENHMTNCNQWYCAKLQNHTTYIIKYFQGPLLDEYLDKTTIIYTDPENKDLHQDFVEKYI